jgi:hypothetical protein
MLLLLSSVYVIEEDIEGSEVMTSTQRKRERHTEADTHREIERDRCGILIIVVKLSRCPSAVTVVCSFSLISHVSLNAYIMPIFYILK